VHGGVVLSAVLELFGTFSSREKVQEENYYLIDKSIIQLIRSSFVFFSAAPQSQKF